MGMNNSDELGVPGVLGGESDNDLEDLGLEDDDEGEGRQYVGHPFQDGSGQIYSSSQVIRNIDEIELQDDEEGAPQGAN